MTKNHNQIVTLSVRDWVGLVGIFVTLTVVILAGYLRHDRYLTEVIVRQGYLAESQDQMSERINQIEERLEGVTRHE
jgi:hypothetical protein